MLRHSLLHGRSEDDGAPPVAPHRHANASKQRAQAQPSHHHRSDRALDDDQAAGAALGPDDGSGDEEESLMQQQLYQDEEQEEGDDDGGAAGAEGGADDDELLEECELPSRCCCSFACEKLVRGYAARLGDPLKRLRPEAREQLLVSSGVSAAAAAQPSHQPRTPAVAAKGRDGAVTMLAEIRERVVEEGEEPPVVMFQQGSLSAAVEGFIPKQPAVSAPTRPQVLLLPHSADPSPSLSPSMLAPRPLCSDSEVSSAPRSILKKESNVGFGCLDPGAAPLVLAGAESPGASASCAKLNKNVSFNSKVLLSPLLVHGGVVKRHYVTGVVFITTVPHAIIYLMPLHIGSAGRMPCRRWGPFLRQLS